MEAGSWTISWRSWCVDAGQTIEIGSTTKGSVGAAQLFLILRLFLEGAASEASVFFLFLASASATLVFFCSEVVDVTFGFEVHLALKVQIGQSISSSLQPSWGRCQDDQEPCAFQPHCRQAHTCQPDSSCAHESLELLRATCEKLL